MASTKGEGGIVENSCLRARSGFFTIGNSINHNSVFNEETWTCCSTSLEHFQGEFKDVRYNEIVRWPWLTMLKTTNVVYRH